MVKITYFLHPCPTCGRNLEIRVQYLGRKVVCQHCRAEFTAHQPVTATSPSAEPGRDEPQMAPKSPLLARAEELLAMFDRASQGATP